MTNFPNTAPAAEQPFPKHPGAMMPGRSGAFNLSSGDRFVHDLDGRRGRADEFTSDGDAYVCWDDGTYDVIKWNHMSPEPAAPAVTLANRAADLNRMCLPHHLLGMDHGEICNAARWAQREIERLRGMMSAAAGMLSGGPNADVARMLEENKVVR